PLQPVSAVARSRWVAAALVACRHAREHGVRRVRPCQLSRSSCVRLDGTATVGVFSRDRGVRDRRSRSAGANASSEPSRCRREPVMNDIARIAFVTAHFEELKGLKLALYGAGLLFGSLLLLTAAASDLTTPPPFMGIVLANMLMSFGFWELEPRYRN